MRLLLLPPYNKLTIDQLVIITITITIEENVMLLLQQMLVCISFSLILGALFVAVRILL
jgi:hypothetical protein